MATRYSYEFKKFASGRQKGKQYVNIRSAKTGRLIRRVSTVSGLKTAHKSAKQQVYRAEEELIDKELREIAKKHKGDYHHLKQRYNKQIEIEKHLEVKRVKQSRKEGKKPYGRKLKTLKKSVVSNIEASSGYVTVWRLYWVVQEGTDTPYIAAQGVDTYQGDQMDKAIKDVKHWSLPIIRRDESDKDYNILPGSGSGACVRLIDRETQNTVDAYQLGVGCARV